MNEKVFSPLSILSLACLSHRTSFCLYWYWCNFNVTRSCLLTPRLHRPSRLHQSHHARKICIFCQKRISELSVNVWFVYLASPHTKTDVFMPKKIYSRLVSAAIGVRFLEEIWIFHRNRKFSTRASAKMSQMVMERTLKSVSQFFNRHRMLRGMVAYSVLWPGELLIWTLFIFLSLFHTTESLCSWLDGSTNCSGGKTLSWLWLEQNSEVRGKVFADVLKLHNFSSPSSLQQQYEFWVCKNYSRLERDSSENMNFQFFHPLQSFFFQQIYVNFMKMFV